MESACRQSCPDEAVSLFPRLPLPRACHFTALASRPPFHLVVAHKGLLVRLKVQSGAKRIAGELELFLLDLSFLEVDPSKGIFTRSIFGHLDAGAHPFAKLAAVPVKGANDKDCSVRLSTGFFEELELRCA